MKLAYVMTDARGETDVLLSALAKRLLQKRVSLAGVVQTNTECAPSHLCDMDLVVLPDGPSIRISQSLGAGARGCRLDPEALEQSVALVGASLKLSPQMLIINKFGKHEADGRGFRPLIGEAMMAGIPVLTGVNGANHDRFLAFCEGMAERLSPDLDALEAWFTQVDALRTEDA
jgi:Protein of unknown function (DUF2478)